MNGYCKCLPPGALQVWVLLYGNSCGCTTCHKYTILPRAGDIAEDSGRGGHERAREHPTPVQGKIVFLIGALG